MSPSGTGSPTSSATRSRSRAGEQRAATVDAHDRDRLATVLLDDLVCDARQRLAAALPSFNFPRPGLSDGTDAVRPATLRGLAPDQTLVLVNSKRLHSAALVNVNGTIGRGSSSADLNTIPSSIVQSVEVLRDGASAQYGSDAIAGVVNVRLRESTRRRRCRRELWLAQYRVRRENRAGDNGRRDLVRAAGAHARPE